jgi:hypothetical protein
LTRIVRRLARAGQPADDRSSVPGL